MSSGRHPAKRIAHHARPRGTLADVPFYREAAEPVRRERAPLPGQSPQITTFPREATIRPFGHGKPYSRRATGDHGIAAFDPIDSGLIAARS